jgi:hypothetical protein
MIHEVKYLHIYIFIMDASLAERDCSMRFFGLVFFMNQHLIGPDECQEIVSSFNPILLFFSYKSRVILIIPG